MRGTGAEVALHIPVVPENLSILSALQLRYRYSAPGRARVQILSMDLHECSDAPWSKEPAAINHSCNSVATAKSWAIWQHLDRGSDAKLARMNA